MSLLSDRRVEARDPQEATRAAERVLDAMIIKQLVASSGAFKGTDGAGSAWTADIFADALADAVSGSGAFKMMPTSLPPAPAKGLATAEPSSLVAPLPPGSAHVTSAYGQRHDPLTGEPRQHQGLDLGAAEGTVIRSALAGQVVRAGPAGGYGNAVEVDHGNGVHTVYAHASRLDVAPGQTVNAGEVLGEVGHTGRATGPHLHFEVRVGGRPVNPEKVLKFYRARADGEKGGSGFPGGIP